MTKRLKLFLAIILGSMAIACCVAGCKIGKPGREEVLVGYNGGRVTYFANGGWFDGNTDIVIRDMYFRNANVPFYNISEDIERGNITVGYTGYDFVCWCLPQVWEDGEHAGEIKYTYTYKNEAGQAITVNAYPKLKSNGTPVTDSKELRPVFYMDGSDEEILERNVRMVADTSKVIDSTYQIKSSDKLTVCATWKPALQFVFKLETDEEGTFTDKNDSSKTYKNGDELKTEPFGREQTATPAETMSIQLSGMTFVANYTEKECVNYAKTFDREYYEANNITYIYIYCKFIKGDWTVIKNEPNKIEEMFTNLGDEQKSYYLLEDITFPEEVSDRNNFGVVDEVRATIEGNGHTLKNLRFHATTSFANGLTAAPVFGTICASAKIRNLTLSNIDISVKGIKNMTFYAVCSSVEEGATLEGLTIENINATVKLPGTVNNAQGDNRNSWVFGGKGTDAAFLAAYPGVTLSGTNTLTITR